MKTKALILAAALAAFFSPSTQAQLIPAQIPVSTLCMKGGPEMLFMFLADERYEVPTHQLRLEGMGMMYITQSDAPSTSIIIHNENAHASCWFWWTEHGLEATGASPGSTPKTES